MNISQFRRNAYKSIAQVRKLRTLKVTSRSGLTLSVRLYTDADADFVHAQWTAMANANSAEWEDALRGFEPFVITVDGAPKLTVERWNEENHTSGI